MEKELPPPAAAAAAETGHTCQSEIYTFSHSATQTSHISPEKQIPQSSLFRENCHRTQRPAREMDPSSDTKTDTDLSFIVTETEHNLLNE